MFIKGKGKIGHLDGMVKMPERSDLLFNKWEEENFMIMSWLVNSMQPKISRAYLFLKKTSDIWKIAKEIYFKVGNTTRIFELNGRIQNTKQGVSQ